MLGHFHFHWRDVKYLALLVSLRFHFFQVRLAVMATLHPMDLHMIRIGYRLECASRMTTLPAAFLATFLPQALGFLLQPIARWRFAAVAAVLGNLIFQPLDTFSQLAKRFMKKLDHSIFAFIDRLPVSLLRWAFAVVPCLYCARLLCF